MDNFQSTAKTAERRQVGYGKGPGEAEDWAASMHQKRRAGGAGGWQTGWLLRLFGVFEIEGLVRLFALKWDQRADGLANRAAQQIYRNNFFDRLPFYLAFRRVLKNLHVGLVSVWSIDSTLLEERRNICVPLFWLLNICSHFHQFFTQLWWLKSANETWLNMWLKIFHDSSVSNMNYFFAHSHSKMP